MPGDSRTLRLGDVADIVMGQSPPGESVCREPRGLPLLNGPTEFGPHHPSPVQFTTRSLKKPRPVEPCPWRGMVQYGKSLALQG
jgi:hypothetical protein